MSNTHREMAHVLGLTNNPFPSFFGNQNDAGWFPRAAVRSTVNRYAALRDGQASLNFHLISSDAVSKVSQLADGGYVGFLTGWTTNPPHRKHAYSLHAIKEGSNTHFIYVNRGQSHKAYTDSDTSTVIVFTITNDAAISFARELISVAELDSCQSRISQFLHTHRDKENAELSRALQKSQQKLGHCTTANSNMAWHLQLASEHMQQSIKEGVPKSLANAYMETKLHYKRMRVYDRVTYFQFLMKNRPFLENYSTYLFSYFSFLAKSVRKDDRKKDRPKYLGYIKTLVETVKGDKKTLNSLVGPLLHEDFTKNAEKIIAAKLSQIVTNQPDLTTEKINTIEIKLRLGLNVAKQRVLECAFQYLDVSLQKAYIYEDNSLLFHASPVIQSEFQNREDADKYALYFKELDKERDHITSEQREKYRYDVAQLTHPRKTSDKIPFSHAKETVINNQLRTLYAHALFHPEKLINTFETLCLICCKRRMRILGKEYATNTRSAQWLIKILEQDQTFYNILRNFIPNLRTQSIENKMEEIISKKQTNPYGSYFLKDTRTENVTCTVKLQKRGKCELGAVRTWVLQ
jgi:hypothetical protein